MGLFIKHISIKWQFILLGKKLTIKGVVSRAQVRTHICESNLGMALCRKLPNTDYEIGTLGNTKLFELYAAKASSMLYKFCLGKKLSRNIIVEFVLNRINPLKLKPQLNGLLNTLKRLNKWENEAIELCLMNTIGAHKRKYY